MQRLTGWTPPAVMTCGGSLLAISLVLFAIWFYATRGAKLADRPDPSIAISSYNVHYSLYVYYAMAILFLLAGRKHRNLEAAVHDT